MGPKGRGPPFNSGPISEIRSSYTYSIIVDAPDPIAQIIISERKERLLENCMPIVFACQKLKTLFGDETQDRSTVSEISAR